MKIAVTKSISGNYFIKLLIDSSYPINAKKNLCSPLEVNFKKVFVFIYVYWGVCLYAI